MDLEKRSSIIQDELNQLMLLAKKIDTNNCSDSFQIRQAQITIKTLLNELCILSWQFDYLDHAY